MLTVRAQTSCMSQFLIASICYFHNQKTIHAILKRNKNLKSEVHIKSAKGPLLP